MASLKQRTTEEPDFFSSGVESVRRFYLSKDETKAGALRVISGGWEKVSREYRVRRSSFPYPSVEFVAAGEGRLLLQGQEHVLGPGALFSYDAKVPHEIETSQEGRLLKYFVNLSGPGALRLLREHKLSPGTFRTCENPDHIRQHFDRLIAACLAPSAKRERLALLHLEILLIEAGADKALGSDRTQAHATYVRCRSFLEREHLTIATAEEGARTCGVDPAYLCRLFAKYAEESPYQFLLRLKMDHAARALEHGAAVKEVAAQLQMNPFHFSRTFRRLHGGPPSRYVSKATQARS